MGESALATVMTFYRFVDLADPSALRDELEVVARRLDLTGTVLLAQEGINGTLSGGREALQAFRQHLNGHRPLADLPCRFSSAAPGNPVFYRLKIRVKAEIVRLDQPAAHPAERTGEHVDAQRWNALLEDPDVLVLDTRNGYEVEIGSFPGARNPGTRSFRELPAWVREHLDPLSQPRIAMFCTGGIRCEKASAWMLEQGFEQVYQLHGGILGYLESVAPDDNRWQGECFVFDQRVSVDTGLTEGSFEQCFACRRPLSAQALTSPHYQPGVSCPSCVNEHTPAQRLAFRERWRQQTLAAARGTRHVGGAPPGAHDDR
jgi:UPF0176 protein